MKITVLAAGILFGIFAAFGPAGSAAAKTNATNAPSEQRGGPLGNAFPAVGHTYRVDFVSTGGQKFTVELVFASETSMTYTGIRPDGSRGMPETVTIEETPVAPNVFVVTWKESDKTTVVHIEDYGNMVFYTNITDGGDAHDFLKFKGNVTLVK
jgi:hypothetical protein